MHLQDSKPNQIMEDTNINFSDKQHRGNVGEGQFHLNDKKIEYHIDNYLLKKMTYEEFECTIKA